MYYVQTTEKIYGNISIKISQAKEHQLRTRSSCGKKWSTKKVKPNQSEVNTILQP